MPYILVLKCAWIAGGPAGRAAVHAAPEAHCAVLPTAFRQPARSRSIATVSPRAPPQGCFHSVPQRRPGYTPLVGSAPGALSVTVFNRMLPPSYVPDHRCVTLTGLEWVMHRCVFLDQAHDRFDYRFLYPETASCVGTDQRGLPCAAFGSRDSASHASAAVIRQPRLVLNVFWSITPLSTMHIYMFDKISQSTLPLVPTKIQASQKIIQCENHAIAGALEL